MKKFFKLSSYSSCFISSILIVSLFFLLAGCEQPPVTNSHSKGITIVCFGGSLTKGAGADKGYDYPSQLSKLVNIPVINAGINGNNTRQELQRIQNAVFSWDPKMVIITQRTNDYKAHIPKEETLRNLGMLIDQIENHGAMAVLVTFEPEALRGYFKDFRELAIRKHALLVAGVTDGIETDPKYKSDETHPNNEGYRVVSQRIFKVIRPYLK